MPRTTRLSDPVLSILSTVRIEGNIVFLTCGMLSGDKECRKLYLDVNAALESLGGKWNRKAKGHVFDSDPTDKIEDAILTGEVTPPSKNGYFPTPAGIVKQLIDLAGVERGMFVLEPSAGRGNIAKPLSDIGAKVTAFELLPENREYLKHNITLYLDPEPDFMKARVPMDGAQFDAVVMNPPFEKQADIDHVLHAYKMLKPGSRLVSVMAAGITFREDKKAKGLRELINNSGGKIIPLPDGAFQVFENDFSYFRVLPACKNPDGTKRNMSMKELNEAVQMWMNRAPTNGPVWDNLDAALAEKGAEITWLKEYQNVHMTRIIELEDRIAELEKLSTMQKATIDSLGKELLKAEKAVKCDGCHPKPCSGCRWENGF